MNSPSSGSDDGGDDDDDCHQVRLVDYYPIRTPVRFCRVASQGGVRESVIFE